MTDVAPTVSFSTIPPSPGTVQLPRGPWIPNVDQITDSAAGLLAVIVAGLNQWGLTDGLERVIFTHGDTIPIVRNEQSKKQLAVAFTGLEIGNAGEKRFQYPMGDIGSFAHHTGNFTVELWFPWPTPTGGVSTSLPQTKQLLDAAQLLNQAGYILFSCLRALALGGVKVNPPITPLEIDGIIPGPMKPLGPSGGMAGWTVEVQCQYT
jgi:hypothetical protein